MHLGFNQDEGKRQVHDGMWPIIAGRRIALNFRWAQPDGALDNDLALRELLVREPRVLSQAMRDRATALGRLTHAPEASLVWTHLTRSDLEATGVTLTDTCKRRLAYGACCVRSSISRFSTSRW